MKLFLCTFKMIEGDFDELETVVGKTTEDARQKVLEVVNAGLDDDDLFTDFDQLFDIYEIVFTEALLD